MRYTHYWATSAELPSIALWNTIRAQCNKALAHFPITNTSTTKKIEFDSTDDPHEYSLFTFPRAPQHFVHCRTFRTDYDLPVTICLLIIKHYAPNWLKITSDGQWEDWQPAVQFIQQHFKTITFFAAERDFLELLDKDDEGYVPLKIATAS
jgi:hypothetical protein